MYIKSSCQSNLRDIHNPVHSIKKQVLTWKLFATQALSQTQKNVSEPQTGIEPATFRSPVRASHIFLSLR